MIRRTKSLSRKKKKIYPGLVWFSFLSCGTKINAWGCWVYEHGPLVLAVNTLRVFAEAMVCALLRERAPFAKLMFGFWVVPELSGALGSFGPSSCSAHPEGSSAWSSCWIWGLLLDSWTLIIFSEYVSNEDWSRKLFCVSLNFSKWVRVRGWAYEGFFPLSHSKKGPRCWGGGV